MANATDISPFRDTVPLAGTGVRVAASLHANLTVPALVAHALRKNEGRLSAEGALIVRTGVHTGRSVADKFVVDEPATTGDVWWGKINQKLPEEKFAVLKARVQAYLQGRELFPRICMPGPIPTTACACAWSPPAPGTLCSRATFLSARRRRSCRDSCPTT